MDYIKVFLLGLIAVIAYYLILQWSNLPEDDVVFEPAKETTKTIREEGLNDSKDLLTALDTTPLKAAESETPTNIDVASSKFFSINNDCLLYTSPSPRDS